MNMSAQSQSEPVVQAAVSKPRRGGRKIIAAIIIVVIIIAVVFWYLRWSSQGGEQGPNKPAVVFGPATVGNPSGNRSALWRVTSVSEQFAFSDFKIGVAMNDTAQGTPQTIMPEDVISLGTTAKAIVHDSEGEGKLTQNDTFLVYGMSGERRWNFTLLWKDDSMVQGIVWVTHPAGPIDFNLMTAGSSWTLQVTDTPPSLSLHWVTLTIKDRSGSIVAPVSAVPLSRLAAINLSTYKAEYARVGSESDVLTGATISADKSVYPSGFRYELSDGFAMLASGTFRYAAIVFNVQRDVSNWTMTVVSAPSGLALTTALMTIKNDTGAIKAPMDSVQLSNLTAANWSTYNVLYRKIGSESEVLTGASINVSRAIYPRGYGYEISDGWAVLASGTFAIPFITLSMQNSGANFTLTVASTSSGLLLNVVTMSIRAPVIGIALSDLTTANWSMYGVVYQKVAGETDVVVGASILVQKSRYPFCLPYRLSDGVDILANGTFFDCSIGVGMMIGVEPSGANWTMTFTLVPSGLALTDVTLTILDVNYNIKAPMDSVPLSDLTLANWNTYMVRYVPLGGGPDLRVGSTILVDRTTYPAGCRWELMRGVNILSTGFFM